MESDDLDTIKMAMEELSKASHTLAEQLYAQKAQAGEAAGTAEGAAPKQDDDVVDADYTEVKQ